MWSFDDLSAEEEKCVVVVFVAFQKFFNTFSDGHNHSNNITNFFSDAQRKLPQESV